MSSAEQLQAEGWDESIVGFATALETDGYDLALERRSDGHIVGRVTAGPDACADCLVPKPVLASVIAQACAVDPGEVELTYPVEAH